MNSSIYVAISSMDYQQHILHHLFFILLTYIIKDNEKKNYYMDTLAIISN